MSRQPLNPPSDVDYSGYIVVWSFDPASGPSIYRLERDDAAGCEDCGKPSEDLGGQACYRFVELHDQPYALELGSCQAHVDWVLANQLPHSQPSTGDGVRAHVYPPIPAHRRR